MINFGFFKLSTKQVIAIVIAVLVAIYIVWYVVKALEGLNPNYKPFKISDSNRGATGVEAFAPSKTPGAVPSK